MVIHSRTIRNQLLFTPSIGDSCNAHKARRRSEMAKKPAINVHYQAAFGTDGESEVAEESVETSLDDYGADVDHRDIDSRIDRPAASEFGVDDRVEIRRSDAEQSDQTSLFVNTAADQQTLSGEQSSAQWCFDE
jgi:hypothetical protein